MNYLARPGRSLIAFIVLIFMAMASSCSMLGMKKGKKENERVIASLSLPEKCLQATVHSLHYKVNVLTPISISAQEDDVQIQFGNRVGADEINTKKPWIKLDTDGGAGQILSQEYSAILEDTRYYTFPRFAFKVKNNHFFRSIRLYLPGMSSGCVTFDMFNSAARDFIRLEPHN